MKTNIKRIFILLVIACAIAGLVLFLRWCHPVNKGQEAEHKECDKLVVAYSGSIGGTKDLQLVQDELNKITRKKLGIEVELKVLNNFKNTINLMLSGKEQLDIMTIDNQMYMEAYINENLWELDELLDQYGTGIKEALGMENINACRIKGKLYGLPNNRDFAAGWDAYMLRKDILDQYNIKKEDIKSIEDLEKVFDLILEKEPDVTPIASSGSMFANFALADGINSFPAGGHLNYGQDEEIVNIFETEEYMENLKRVRKWYLKGYMGDRILEDTQSMRDKIREGTVFSYPQKGKPGIERQESMSYGKELVIVQFGENAISYNSLAAVPWVITKNTISKEKSMQLLNLMYTDADIMNLLSYGVENIHYVKTEDGHIKLPSGAASNVFIKGSWKMPNQFITYVWEGNPLDLWERMEEYNNTALRSCEIGFNFDVSQVSTEYITLEKIYNKYKPILESGLVDPEEGLQEMMNELNANGLQEVIAEKRRQFEEWQKEYKK